MSHKVSVIVHTPAHSGLADVLSYESEEILPTGTLVRVPLGKREMLGIVWQTNTADDKVLTNDASKLAQDNPALTLRPIASVLGGIAPLNPHW